MKILLAFPRPLVPADTGGKIRSLQIFSRLASRSEVHAISHADPERDAEGVCEMRRIFASYTPVYWQESIKYSPSFYLDLVRNQFSSLPYFIGKFCQAKFTKALGALADTRRFDLLFCDFLQTAAPALELPMRPRVVFEHNVEYLLRKRQWEVESMPLKKWVFDAEWKKTQSVEAQVCRSYDHVIAVSEDDCQILKRDFGIRHVSPIPSGVDTNYFRPHDISPRPGHLVFVGTLDWYPNEDAIVWFCQEVFPLILQAVPNARLKIVGPNPPARLRRIAVDHPAVEVKGRVPDVRPYLSEAEVVVVPLRVGGGTRIKIPEAMAMARPVVSTRIGAEGLPFTDGNEILLADRPEEFSRSVVELLKNGSRRAAMGQAARERVVREHTWDSVADRVEDILERVAKRAPKTTIAEAPVRIGANS